MKYAVHYSGYYGYDVVVDAENEDDARELADLMEETDPVSLVDYDFNPRDVYVRRMQEV